MDIREEIRQEGHDDGWEKGQLAGIQIGQQKVALNMLKKRLDISLISKVTGLSAKEINKLKNDS